MKRLKKLLPLPKLRLMRRSVLLTRRRRIKRRRRQLLSRKLRRKMPTNLLKN